MIILQIGKGSRGDVTILPTLVINNRQYRGTLPYLSLCGWSFIIYSVRTFDISGKLAKQAVLKAICSGFEETTEPAVCLSDG